MLLTLLCPRLCPSDGSSSVAWRGGRGGAECGGEGAGRFLGGEVRGILIVGDGWGGSRTHSESLESDVVGDEGSRSDESPFWSASKAAMRAWSAEGAIGVGGECGWGFGEKLACFLRPSSVLSIGSCAIYTMLRASLMQGSIISRGLLAHSITQGMRLCIFVISEIYFDWQLFVMSAVMYEGAFTLAEKIFGPPQRGRWLFE